MLKTLTLSLTLLAAAGCARVYPPERLPVTSTPPVGLTGPTLVHVSCPYFPPERWGNITSQAANAAQATIIARQGYVMPERTKGLTQEQAQATAAKLGAKELLVVNIERYEEAQQYFYSPASVSYTDEAYVAYPAVSSTYTTLNVAVTAQLYDVDKARVTWAASCAGLRYGNPAYHVQAVVSDVVARLYPADEAPRR